MLKRTKYLLIYLFIYLFGHAQINLVPNYSFEDTIGDCTSIPFAFVNKVKKWYPAKESPDYFNTCTNLSLYPYASTIPYNCHGSQSSHSNNAHSAIALYYLTNSSDSINISSELIGVKLIQSLKANKCYYGEFYISLAEISDIAINRIGMLLTQNTYTLNYQTYDNIIQPQIKWDSTQYFKDTLNWTKVSGTFIAQGGEEYLTIGNFRDGMNVNKQFISRNFTNICNIGNAQNVSYVFVDDVSLYELPTPQLQSNAITICPNADTLVLGDTTRIQTRYQWFANGTAIDTTSFIKVKPNQTTTYVLQSTNCTTTSQTIVVTYSNNCEPVVVVEPLIPNVFTPNNDSINDVWRFSLGKGNVLKDIAIFNRWGNIIYQKNNNLTQTTVLWDGRTTAGEETPSGVYFYVLQYTDANGDEHKKNGYITLIK
jgi:gliding motility-associated-like protein